MFKLVPIVVGACCTLAKFIGCVCRRIENDQNILNEGSVGFKTLIVRSLQ